MHGSKNIYFGIISNPRFTFSKSASPVKALVIFNSCIKTKDVKSVNEILGLSFSFFLSCQAILNLSSAILSNTNRSFFIMECKASTNRTCGSENNISEESCYHLVKHVVGGNQSIPLPSYFFVFFNSTFMI